MTRDGSPGTSPSRFPTPAAAPRERGRILDELEADGAVSGAVIDEAEFTVEALESLAERADLAWERIQQAVARRDSELFEATDEGITIIRSRGPDRTLYQQILKIWGQTRGRRRGPFSV